MASSNCVVENCKTTIYNKGPGVLLHPCPTNNETRRKWAKILKNRCCMLDWSKSKICSKHFENKWFDGQRRLKENAIPTMFAITKSNTQATPQKSKVDRLLNKLTQAELAADIKNSLARLKEPFNLDAFVKDDLNCRSEAPTEAKLWLMIKKQENLNARLTELVVQTKNHVEILQNNIEQSKSVKLEQEQNIESLKYIVKCLQEKHATLEEQVEILTSFEAR